MSEPNMLFANLDREYLEQHGILFKADLGECQVHSKVLHCASSTAEAYDIYHSSMPASAADFTKVPDNLHSPATFKYIGFDAVTSEVLYASWSALNNETLPPCPLITFATNYLEENGKVTSNTLEGWTGVFRRLGIARTMFDAIMSEKCDQLRLMKSPIVWMSELMAFRFMNLGLAQVKSHQRANAIDLVTMLEHLAAQEPDGEIME